MRFSVIMPVHNAGPFIAEALDSIAEQTLAPFEVIVIDDASSDDSMTKVAASGLSLQVLRTEARNAAIARNLGIAHARGDWLAFLDADDIWHPMHLAHSAELLDGRDAVGMLAHHMWRRAGVDEPMPESLRCGLSVPEPDLPASCFPDLMRAGFHFGHSTEVLLKSRADAVSGFDESRRRRHDIDLWLRAIAGHRWAFDPRVHATYRVDNPNSISKAEIACEIAYLDVLLQHEQAYAGDAMRELIAVSSRRAMGLAFVDGTSDEFAAARERAWIRLSPAFRAGYRAFALAPALARALLRQKRAWLNSGP